MSLVREIHHVSMKCCSEEIEFFCTKSSILPPVPLFHARRRLFYSQFTKP